MAFGGMRPGLIWGLDFTPSGSLAVETCDAPQPGALRWLHLNLADHGTRSWIENAPLPADVRELLLSPDTHQRALVDGDTVGCVLHDFERDFDVADTARIGALRIALTPTLILTTRSHPIRSADIVRQRLERMPTLAGPAAALDLLVGAITENVAGISRTLSDDVRIAEDALLDGRDPPTTRDLIGIRRRIAQIHRLLGGMREVFHRLEEDEELPEVLLATVEKLVQRLHSLDGDIIAVQGELRLLREELDIQAAQRTNQNLYILSIMTALLLPATLVTGIFGMNTGGMPLASPVGTAGATALALGAAAATYLLLRWLGFMRR
jgi:zinc transporter